jgi:predicted 2-oxoglutarate/Fe(II)-dependent dioxygenase YbiX
MSLPFIIKDELEEINLTSIYILRNVISNEKMQDIKKFIDKYANIIGEYSDENNVKSTYLHFQDIEQYNSKIYQEIKRTFEYIRNKTEIPIHNLKSSVDYSAMQLRKINGPTRMHVDALTSPIFENQTTNIRIYSVIVALNSDYEGGQFYFPRQNVTVKLKAGEALIFPPYWTHPHCTNALNGTFRYTINTWFSDCNPEYGYGCWY